MLHALALALAIAPPGELDSSPPPSPHPPPPPPVVFVDRDDVEIRASCTIRIAGHPIPDANDDGVIHVVGSGIEVRFDPGTPLRGAADDRPQAPDPNPDSQPDPDPDQQPAPAPDSFTGLGVSVTGQNVTLSGLRVRGYKVGLLATGADGLTVRDCDVSDNYRQRLLSTPRAENTADWLSPHANDQHEWRRTYGAGICVENSSNVTIHRVRARRGQNGIILDRVERALVYDNDCSFLSGWGLAMWRSSRNVVSRNAFDFCVRGYSHGVYNRGQDAAGILIFEQCSENVFAENSATHGGDGVFGFAGREALGESNPRDDLAWYERRGCNDNLFVGNDFSYAAAHGLEMTFSFGNRIVNNRFVENAICGVWAGYAQDTLITGNRFDRNGDAGYGLERGGVNIEHGTGNEIRRNRFSHNPCGVHFWWDPDEHLSRLPWAQTNHVRALVNVIQENVFDGETVAIQLRATSGTTHVFGNDMQGVTRPIDADDDSPVAHDERAPRAAPLTPPLGPGPAPPPPHATLGETRPVGARALLHGRARIVLTEWGPRDWTDPASASSR